MHTRALLLLLIVALPGALCITPRTRAARIKAGGLAEEHTSRQLLQSAPGAGAGCMCIALYAPVCGVDGKTYSNSCVAKCEGGVEVAREGACSSDGEGLCFPFFLVDCACVAVSAS